ncbi:excalibur calcium-binding domain-containing protein [Streptomyces sp. SBC-4]|nr:excalibur calcium-binding domain-containing protein [Streptomyces sp. SBC-4]MDV5148571.1 excalibur calcium-binding domain-containing protein [Streptomyces sp. SBC-4]
MGKTNGPLWLRKSRGIRRWWARRGAWAKRGIIAAALLITLLVVAGIEGAGEPGEGPTPVPTPTVTETETEEPTVPATGTATIPAPVEPEPVAPPPPHPPPTSAPEPVPEETTTESVYYENCDAARAAGAAPILLGQPGYRAELDRNRDGVACEE